MTNEEMNTAIAEHFDQQTYCPDDYCGDLNLMHEAERTLGANARYYEDHLANLFSDGFLSASYTAVQRAEAFLRTVGKYAEAEGPV